MLFALGSSTAGAELRDDELIAERHLPAQPEPVVVTTGEGRRVSVDHGPFRFAFRSLRVSARGAGGAGHRPRGCSRLGAAFVSTAPVYISWRVYGSRTDNPATTREPA
jgi:hypothetical protein